MKHSMISGELGIEDELAVVCSFASSIVSMPARPLLTVMADYDGKEAFQDCSYGCSSCKGLNCYGKQKGRLTTDQGRGGQSRQSKPQRQCYTSPLWCRDDGI